MKNWRLILTNILRASGGDAHLSEIYEQVKALRPELEKEWQAAIRENLYLNSSDSKAWEGKYNLFECKVKGSGHWFLRTNYFREEVLNSNTRFFILDTGRKTDRDPDYEIYTWNAHSFNKVKPGDLFIYRRPQKTSPTKQFYFFGAGKIETISSLTKSDFHFQKEGDVCANISNPIHFDKPILQGDIRPLDLADSSNNQDNTWSSVFNNNGMNEIIAKDFLFLLNLGIRKDFKFDRQENEIKIKAHKQVLNGDFSVPDSKCNTTKSRGKWQQYFRESLIFPNYGRTCAITGIKTESLLTASHILKWSEHEGKRIDPQNGICLSKLVDKCFEDILIYIDENYKVQFSEKVKKDKDLYDHLKIYENKIIRLPKDTSQRPKKEYLLAHRKGG